MELRFWGTSFEASGVYFLCKVTEKYLLAEALICSHTQTHSEGVVKVRLMVIREINTILF